MKAKNWIPLLMSLTLLGTTVCISAFRQPQPQHEPTAVKTPATAEEARQPTEEMRGVWVTYMELSMEYEENRSEAAFREKFAHIAHTCRRNGFNTLIVHVRPFCDALYHSAYFPSSHVLTGEQGIAPDYDALKVMCEICRDFGLNVHAWINTYRLTANDTPEELCDENVFLSHPEMCLETDSGIILNPADAKARELIENGVRELAENYDIDGIQIDDYFYPDDIGAPDRQQYEEYIEAHPLSPLNLNAWRELNVNILLSELYLLIHHCEKDIMFGISPQGHLSNNEALAADVVSWCCAKGFADYICPQLYFSPEHPQLPFEQALTDWTDLELADGVKLYGGLAGYKAATDADEGTWEYGDTLLSEEYNILKKNQKCDGMMLYSFSALEDEEKQTEIKALTDAFD